MNDMPGFPVILVRGVVFPGDPKFGSEPNKSMWAKPQVLPIPPFIGMGIHVDAGCDPENIEYVFVNECGAVVCVLPYQIWKECDIEGLADIEKQRSYLTRGFFLMPHGLSYYRMSFREAQDFAPTSP